MCSYMVGFANSVTYCNVAIYRAFSNITGQNTDTYSYNPCYSFTDMDCENVAVSYCS